MDHTAHLVLTLSCRDVAGIVAAVSGFVFHHKGFIIESTQFGDPSTERFFLRMEWRLHADSTPRDEIHRLFEQEIATPFAMDWQLRNYERKQRVMILVSKFGHCLNDLMHRYRTGSMPIDIVGVISNHEDFRQIVEWHDIPYHYLPVTPADKAQQEQQIWDLFEKSKTDVVVLARYMQILSPELSRKLAGRAINIHHSFLPSFKGARPYHQAYERGVKLIGATAHYVTDNLDEGPIIEQEVARVDHAASPEQLVAIGRDIESVVLARALTYHVEHRVIINGNKTVVFK